MKHLLALFACAFVRSSRGGSSNDATNPDPASAAPDSTNAASIGSELPDNFAYPPGAEVEEMAPGITQHMVRETTVDLLKAY